jgi:hypothetical protein
MRRQRLLVVLIMALLVGGAFLTGCNVDCGWSVQGEAWVDQNGNQKWDDGELPLPGVRFSFLPSGKFVDGQVQATSNQDGIATMSLMLAGCPKDAELKVSVDVPDGYWTPESQITLEGLGPDVVQFGFVPIGE